MLQTHQQDLRSPLREAELSFSSREGLPTPAEGEEEGREGLKVKRERQGVGSIKVSLLGQSVMWRKPMPHHVSLPSENLSVASCCLSNGGPVRPCEIWTLRISSFLLANSHYPLFPRQPASSQSSDLPAWSTCLSLWGSQTILVCSGPRSLLGHQLKVLK